jgi:hypothetical protein
LYSPTHPRPLRLANQLNQIKDILEQRNMSDVESKAAESFQYRAAWDVQVQQATERATFDLNNPNELKERPKWTDEDDVGPSSLRRFAGEDTFAGDRKKMQAAQMRDWVAQQTDVKQQRRAAEQAEDDRQAAYLNQVDVIREEMHQAERAERVQVNLAVAQRNRELAAARRAERAEESALAKELGVKHNATVDADPMMREARDQARSRFPGRVRRDHWKGMTTSELAAIQAENEAVRMERLQLTEAARAEERQRARQTEDVVRALQERYEAERAQKVEEALQVKSEQAVQRREKVVRDRELRQQFNTNKVTDGFFNRFGQSCR